MKKNYDFTGKNILLVEDNKDTLTVLKYTLEHTGADISSTDNGNTAIVLAHTNKNLDLIVMDINLPEMDGYTATRNIRTFNSLIPIIAYTAYASKEDEEKCLNVGCNAYLSKPVPSELLLHTIDKYLK